MLLLGICLVQTGESQDDRPRGLGTAKGMQMREDILLSVIEALDRDQHEVSLRVEAREVLDGIVTRLIEAARVEKGEQRGLRRGEVIEARVASAGLEAAADLGIVSAVRNLTTDVLPLCVLPNSQKRGTGRRSRSRSSCS